MKAKFFIILICFAVFASSAFAQTEAVKVEEFGYINCEEYLARMDYAINETQNNPNAIMYVLVYEGKTKRYKYKKDGSYESVFDLPQRGLAKTRIISMKKYLAVRGFPVERFVFIEAGLRENFTIEMWLVPNGIMPPKSTPTITEIKYRKGKPRGFCLGCCKG
jgi:hypothetical protein